jgi:hypothetical protein
MAFGGYTPAVGSNKTEGPFLPVDAGCRINATGKGTCCNADFCNVVSTAASCAFTAQTSRRRSQTAQALHGHLSASPTG